MQLTLQLEAGISEIYPTCREYIATRVHQLGKYQKQIAADMDLSPSHLSRKLAQAPNDTMAFTLDNLEQYIQTQHDTKPILYLVEKYMTSSKSEIQRLKARIAELEANGK